MPRISRDIGGEVEPRTRPKASLVAARPWQRLHRAARIARSVRDVATGTRAERFAAEQFAYALAGATPATRRLALLLCVGAEAKGAPIADPRLVGEVWLSLDAMNGSRVRECLT